MDYKGHKILFINNQIFVSLGDTGMVFCTDVGEAKRYIDHIINRS